MDISKTLLRTGVLAAAFATLAAVSMPASAATCTGGGVTFTLTPADDDDDEFCGDGDLSHNSIVNLFEMDWTLADLFETDGGAQEDGNKVVTWNNAPSPGDTNWSVNLMDYEGPIMIHLKQGQGFGAFMVDAGVSSGTWGTSAENNDISHAGVWVKVGNGTTVIPVPASLPLLLAALGGIGLLTRRRAS